MRRVLISACVLFAFATGGVAGYIISQDRADTLRVVGERTRSMSRMIIAHGDAATDAAQQVISGALPLVTGWDLASPDTGRTIFLRLQGTVQGNSILAAAWVLDSHGNSVADSESFPPVPMNEANRPYFAAHLSGAADPVITGDDKPGTVPGKEHFTVSRAVRNPDGTLKAIIAVGVYKNSFDTLYKEAVTWPGARAGLYTTNGDILARIRNVKRASPGFVKEMNLRVGSQPSGTALVLQDDEPRIVSWNRSATHLRVYATSSQPVTDALEEWQARAWTTALLTLAVNAVFWGLAWFILRWSVARQEAEANALAVREVNHRVKNSLQLISSLMHIRARKTDDPAYRDAAKELTAQLTALAETYRFVQGANSLEAVDAAVTLQGLCRHLEETYGVAIAVDATPPVAIHANHATAFAVIVNELVTNAIKHGGGQVRVTIGQDGDALRLCIASDRGQLPEGFNIDEQKGFGLRAVRTMLQPLGGRMTAANADGGTAFTVIIPAATLRKG